MEEEDDGREDETHATKTCYCAPPCSPFFSENACGPGGGEEGLLLSLSLHGYMCW